MPYKGGVLTYREFMQRAKPFGVQEIRTKQQTSRRKIERPLPDGQRPWATVPGVKGEGQRELRPPEINSILRRLEFSEEEMDKF
jgi:hypothetical protein